jgi:arabinose-5-phosphate isomerase
VGKSGIIAQKIAATLASTGSPAFFLHPTDAFHGDLGMLQTQDVVMAISYSGETEELLRLIPFLVNREIPIIALTGNPLSTLARHSHFHLNVAVEKEACPLALAPTSSTTATLAMGDALAVALMYARDFRPEDFARFHPGGSLGKKLLTTVESIMVKENLPTCTISATMKSVISTITKGKLGLVVITEENSRKILGIITDGDLRRAMDTQENLFFQLVAENVMTSSPKTIPLSTSMANAEQYMTEWKITSLIVAEEGLLLGVVQVYHVT